MKQLVIVLAVVMVSACGTPKQSADVLAVINDLIRTSCVTIASCIPPKARGGVSPQLYCDALEAAGEIAEFIAREQSRTCPVE